MSLSVGPVHAGRFIRAWIVQLACVSIFASASFSQSDSTTTCTGQAQCQLSVQSQGYVHQEIQTWALTGAAPTQQGAMQVYPATWSVSGQGGAQRAQGAQMMAAQWNSSVPSMNAPIAIFVRASDNRLMIKLWHAQLAAFGGTNSIKQLGSTQTSAAYTTYEWQFPTIDDVATSTNVSGTGTVQVSGNAIPIPSANGNGVATCKWQFTKGQGTLTTQMPSVVSANTAFANTSNANTNIPTSTIAPMPAPPGGASANSQASSTNTTQPVVMGPAGSHLTANNPAVSQMTSTLKPPPPPGGFTATAGDLGSVQFNWQPVTGATKYRLEGPGMDATGVYVSAPATNATSNHIPEGPNTWKLASVNADGIWDKNNEASASAMVRYAPPHSPQWLTKNNGVGNPGLALAHYLSLCSQCLPGTSFADVIQALGVSQVMMNGDIYNLCPDPDRENPRTGGGEGQESWVDQHAARYTNVTEFNSSARATRCWSVIPGLRLVCYTRSHDHGLQVIVKEGDSSWFLSFEGPNPDAEVLIWDETDTFHSSFNMVDHVTLDSEGVKYPPHACLSCHGGQFANGRVTGATLLPLDPGLLQFSDRSDVMASNVLGVNQAVMDNAPSQSVAQYLTELYGGNPHSASGWGNTNYVPQGWADEAAFYTIALKPHCAMCHLATPRNLNFLSAGNFQQNKAAIYSDVCSGHSMPHAEQPFKQFWTKDTGSVFVPGWLVGQLGYQSCP